ncbi:hypothetical protein LIER_37110 [Lithospermum erythrorhizon]|uniref:Uncharacterized protein n=1 Tax=Lithospermum erythrorhizon TaxID=34254 RepID=A0AAV3PFC5_LITER
MIHFFKRNNLPSQQQELVKNGKLQLQSNTSRTKFQNFRSDDEDPSLDTQTDSSESDEQSDSESQVGRITRKKKGRGRGAAKFPYQWNCGRRLDVTLNAQGQMVGEHYQELATAIGCLAKVGSSFPITCESWNNLDKKKKETSLERGRDKRVDDEDQFQEAIRHWKKSEVQLVSNGISDTQLDIWLLSRSIGKGVKEDYETSNLYVSEY